MPSLLQIPDIDYSIFEYFGQRMREGQLPYRDIYDHKPPLIFFLNYWGLVLGSGSRWGIWALQLAAVSAAGLIGFLGLRPIFRPVSRLAGFRRVPGKPKFSCTRAAT